MAPELFESSAHRSGDDDSTEQDRGLPLQGPGEEEGRQSSPPPSRGPAWLPDVWSARGGVRLNGTIERSTISPTVRNAAMALAGVVVTFLVFQAVANLLVVAWMFAKIPAEELQNLQATASAQAEILGRLTREVFLSNSIGQVVGFGLVTYGLARLHTTEVGSFLRLRRTDWAFVGLSLLGLVALQPGVRWLMSVNQMIPLPEALEQFEQVQMEMIQAVMESDASFWFNLAMIALIPGVFEELGFRGYVQRQLERASGPGLAIFLSGLLFGLYHLRPSHLLPLTLLGVYLAYITWRTGSLLPAILVHFGHNALAVGAVRYARASESVQPEALQEGGVPVHWALLGFVFFGAVVYVLHHRASAARDTRAAQFETATTAESDTPTP